MEVKPVEEYKLSWRFEPSQPRRVISGLIWSDGVIVVVS